MAEFKAQEDPISPLSPQGFAKSSFVLLHIFKARRAPQITFLLAIILWVSFFFVEPVCLLPGHVRQISTDHWKVWTLHAFAPQSFIRTCLIGALLLLLGYSCEDRIGMVYFLGLFHALHFGIGTLLLYFSLTPCYQSLEIVLVACAPIFHGLNPVFHSDSIAKNIRVPFAIAPRWHYWVLVFILMLTRSPFSKHAVLSYFIGLTIGVLCVLRYPESWTFKLSLIWPKLVLYFLVVLFVPVTTFQLWVWDGPTIMALAEHGMLGAGSSVVTCSLCLMPISTLAVYDMPWFPRAVYSVSSALLAMYSMDSVAWNVPGPGFLAIILLAISFLLKK